MRRRLLTLAAMAVTLVLPSAASARSSAIDEALRAADAPAAQLEIEATPTLPGGTVVHRYTQEVDGVPVVGAGAVVIDPADGPAELLFDKTDPSVAGPGEPAISRATAEEAAANAIGLRRAWGAPSIRLVIFEEHLAWEVSQTARRPLGDWLVYVDAATGSVVEKGNLIRRAQGQAQLFVPNPVVMQGSYTGLRDRKDKDSALLTDLRTPVTLENIKDGQTCLKGDWVSVKLSKNKKNKRLRVCRDSLNWNGVTRSSNKFEALMAYHHIDQAQQYIQTLGLPDPANAEPQNVLADAYLPPAFGQDNSFYKPSTDQIWTGQGGVDDGEDADVFVHEYGHAVQDAQNHQAFNTLNLQTGAQGEGFSDYFAAAYSAEVAATPPASDATLCIAEWDSTSYAPRPSCLRRADNPNTRPEQQDLCEDALGHKLRNEVHCIGEIWSAALFELRAVLGDDGGGDSIMDKVVFASHEILPPAPIFNEASEALITADESEYGGGDHCTEIRAELVSRELLSDSFSCP